MELKIEDGFELLNEVFDYYDKFSSKEFWDVYWTDMEKYNELRRSLIIVQLTGECPKNVLTEIYFFNQLFFTPDEGTMKSFVFLDLLT